MISATQIQGLRTQSVDYHSTEALKGDLAGLLTQRQPMYLLASEFDRILRWKLRDQYNRHERHRTYYSDDIVKAVTRAALSFDHPDPEFLLELQVGVLCALRGVAVPVASSVLALCYPQCYAVIDFRGWRQVFDEYRSEGTFTVPEYKRYMVEIRRLADELGWPPQEVDLAIWEYDRQFGNPGARRRGSRGQN